MKNGLSSSEFRTVSEVNRMIAETYQMTECLNDIFVKGEVTNYRGPNAGHRYFDIKEGDRAQLSCILWKGTYGRLGLKFELEPGMQVAIIGDLRLYEKTGKTSLHVNYICRLGEGEDNLKYQQLMDRLEKEGLFREDHKKPIPLFPKSVGVVTSMYGQARRDIEQIAKRRNPYVQLVLYHVNVQGEHAVSTIVEGIKKLDEMGLDSIIVGRGGGSDEELKAYKDEAIARAVYEAKTPIVSAVGHEGNWTLIDYVADRRCATPSEAAEITVPDVMTTVRRLRQLESNLRINMRNSLNVRELKLKALMKNLEALSPERLLKERMDRLKHLEESLRQGMRRSLDLRMNRYEVLLAGLHGLSPTAKLVRGFGYISSKGRPLLSVGDLKVKDRVDIRIHDGEVRTVVEEIQKNGDS